MGGWILEHSLRTPKEPDMASGSQVVTMFIRLHPGAQKGNAANYWSLFEPHYKQNIYANPKRTAKSFVLLIGCIQPVICSKILSVPLFFPFTSQRTSICFFRYRHRSHGKVSPSRGAKKFFRIRRGTKEPRCFFGVFGGFFQRESGGKSICYRHHPSRSGSSQN